MERQKTLRIINNKRGTETCSSTDMPTDLMANEAVSSHLRLEVPDHQAGVQ